MYMYILHVHTTCSYMYVHCVQVSRECWNVVIIIIMITLTHSSFHISPPSLTHSPPPPLPFSHTQPTSILHPSLSLTHSPPPPTPLSHIPHRSSVSTSSRPAPPQPSTSQEPSPRLAGGGTPPGRDPRTARGPQYVPASSHEHWREGGGGLTERGGGG